LEQGKPYLAQAVDVRLIQELEPDRYSPRMTGRNLEGFIDGLPKAELHVHQVGSASPCIVAELAQRHPESPVPKDPEALAAYFRFEDFARFVEVYLSVVDLIRTPEDVRTLTYEVGRDMAAQQIRYAEVTCTPYTSVIAGISGEDFCEAIEDARLAVEAEFGLVLRWCFDIPGEFALPAADETARIATEVAPPGLVAFGLGGPEIGFPRPQFKPAFDRARAVGLHSVPHAGETTGPETIWDSLRYLGAERIGHGTSATQDAELLSYLAAEAIPLEVCPTSNVATRAVASLGEHPIAAMVEAGVVVTVNSDDPPMFSTTLNQEYGVAAELLGLDRSGLADLARTAVRVSFADETTKARVLAEIDAYMVEPVFDDAARPTDGS
jgi:aminodeoxyfutalosine deaminase